MKIYKTIERKYTDEIIDTIICDCCKKSFNDEWDKEGHYDFLETKVEYKRGFSTSDGGWEKKVTFDICPECFTSKLIPLLEKEFFIEVTETESDW